MMPSYSPTVRRRIIAEYAGAVPVKVIAHRYGVKAQTVSRIAKEARLTSRLRLFDLNREEIIDAYNEGLTATMIGAKLGLPWRGMITWLRKNGFPVKRGLRPLGETKPYLVADIVHDYLSGEMSATEVGRLYGVTEMTVRRYVREAGFEVRRRGYRPPPKAQAQGADAR